MKAQLGRPTGLALVLLSTLLATFLALGVFSVALANEHTATRGLSPTTVTVGSEVTVTITLNGDYGDGGSVKDTLPAGFSLVSGSIEVVGGERLLRPTANEVRAILLDGGATSVTYKVTAPPAAGGPHTFVGSFVDSAGDPAVIDGPTVTVTAAATNGGATNGGDAPVSYDLSTDVASAGVRIEIDTSAETAIPAGEDITVTLKDWGLPSSIPTSSVLILGTTASQAAEPYSGEPSEVRIGSGNKVVLSLTLPLCERQRCRAAVGGPSPTASSSSSLLASPTPPKPGLRIPLR